MVAPCWHTAQLRDKMRTRQADEEPSPGRPLSLCRAPRTSKKKAYAKKAKHAALIRWGNREAAAATAAAATAANTAAGENQTVQWGTLFTHDAMASATHAVEHLLAVRVLKGRPHAGSRRLRSIAAAVHAAELGGGPEHDQLAATELSKLAHGFARCQR